MDLAKCSMRQSQRSTAASTSIRRALAWQCLREAIVEPSATFLRTELRPRLGGVRHHRCDRGAGRRVDGSARHRRRGRAVRADVRQLPGVHLLGRRGCQAGHPPAAELRVRPRRVPRRDHTEDEAAADQQPAQPHRACAERSGVAVHRRHGDRTRPDRDHRRGLRAPRVRWLRPHASRHHPWHARAHVGDLEWWQDVQHHRLEDRLDLCAAGVDRRGSNGEAVPHLRQRCSVPTGDRGRSRLARFVLHGVRCRHAEQA